MDQGQFRQQAPAVANVVEVQHLKDVHGKVLAELAGQGAVDLPGQEVAGGEPGPLTVTAVGDYAVYQFLLPASFAGPGIGIGVIRGIFPQFFESAPSRWAKASSFAFTLSDAHL